MGDGIVGFGVLETGENVVNSAEVIVSSYKDETVRVDFPSDEVSGDTARRENVLFLDRNFRRR